MTLPSVSLLPEPHCESVEGIVPLDPFEEEFLVCRDDACTPSIGQGGHENGQGGHEK